VVDLRKIGEAALPISQEQARAELTELAAALYRDNYYTLAAAIARYLLNGGTLDEALGLEQKKKRGVKPYTERTRKAFLMRLRGDTWEEIGEALAADPDTLRKSVRLQHADLMAEEISRRIG